MVLTWPVMTLTAFIQTLSGDGRLVARIHGIHTGAENSAAFLMVAM